jgi:rubrerythrin
MKATIPGSTRTGAAASPEGTQAMVQAAAELTPPTLIDTRDSDAHRIRYIQEAKSVGSIPPPAVLKGLEESGVARIRSQGLPVLLDKLGERIAFERGGARLYDALILKYGAISREAGLPPAEQVLGGAEDMSSLAPVQGEAADQTLMRIRSEELAHFRMLCEAMSRLGGDPTAQTPCAGVIATASLGLIQVVTDPRTTLAECLNALLTAELTDNAGWELLIQLADKAGEAELSGLFLGALAQEQEHLATIRGWLTNLVTGVAGTPAV